MAERIDSSRDDPDIEQIDNKILNEDVNEEYGVLEEDNTFRRTENKKPAAKEESYDTDDIADEDDYIDKNADNDVNEDIDTVQAEEEKEPDESEQAEKKGKEEIGTDDEEDEERNRRDDKGIIKRKAPKSNQKKNNGGKKIALKVQAPAYVEKKNGKNSKNGAKNGNKNETNRKDNGQKSQGNHSDKDRRMNEKSNKKNREHIQNDLRVEKMKHKTKKKNNIWMWITFAAILVVVIVGLIFALKYVNMGPKQQKNSEIAATVNGENIYMSEIDMKYNSLNPILQGLYTKEVLLNQTIDEILLIQEAKNRGIAVTADEIDSELENFRLTNGVTEEQLEEILKKQNLTINELSDLIERKLVVRDLLNETILQGINISESQIKEYYDTNKEMFMTPEQVKAAHILIGFEDRTEEEPYAIIKDIEANLTDKNFCELTAAYSEDPGSKDNCGEYTFGKNEMVTEFEEAAFRLDDDEMEIVKTVYGYHLVKKLESYPATQQALSEVSEDIKQALYDKTAQDNFDSFMNGLRDKAVIVNYLMLNAEAEKAITSTDDIVNIDDITAEETAAQEPTIEVNTEEIKPAEKIETTVTVKTSVDDLDDFAKCLTDNDIKMYGAYDNALSTNNKKLFGDSFQYVDYVECGVEGNTQLQSQACKDAKIEGYPTWTVDGQKYPGEQSLDRLAQLSGCEQ